MLFNCWIIMLSCSSRDAHNLDSSPIAEILSSDICKGDTTSDLIRATLETFFPQKEKIFEKIAGDRKSKRKMICKKIFDKVITLSLILVALCSIALFTFCAIFIVRTITTFDDRDTERGRVNGSPVWPPLPRRSRCFVSEEASRSHLCPSGA